MTLPWATLALALLSAAPPAAGAPDAKERDYFTDTPLVNQDGQRVRFYSDVLKDQVVVVNVIFTRCKDACPLITRKLLQVREALGERLGQQVRFVSISLDPGRDGPAELRAFARAQQAVHPRWTFLTGKKEDVEQVLKRLGQYAEAPELHSTLLLAGNVRQRRWTKLRPEVPPAALAERLRDLLEKP